MATLRELKGRIGSVASSEKITGAMKMISSAKMHKAEAALRRLVPFRSQIETILANILASDATFDSPLTTAYDNVHDVLLVAWGSDDGLCGAYNVNIFKYVTAYVDNMHRQLGENVIVNIMPIGKKLAKAVEKIDLPGVRAIPCPEGVNSKSSGTTVNNFAAALQKMFVDGQMQRVDLAYMKFFSAGRQRPQAQQLLPMLPETYTSGEKKKSVERPYIFEPGASQIFAAVLPMALMSTIQDAFAQNQASEQAARVMAMQSANDNAKSLLEQLQLEYNKLRQQSITSELLDIVGGQVRE